MLSRSSKNLSRRGESLDLQTPHSRSREKVAPTHKTRDRENMATLRTTSPSHNTRRVMRSRRRTWENGVNTIKSLGTTLKNVCSKQSLVAEMKYSKSEEDSDSESNPERRKQIIDVEPSATVATTKFQPSEPEEPEEGEHLFHSQMWVKGALLHFIVYSGSQKNLISVEVIKRLDLSITPHPQPYTIGWLRQGRDLHISQQCHLPYNIKPFKDEVLCDIYPLEVCDVLLGKPYLWKRHVVYESRPCNVIITLGRQLYRILEVASPTTISLISAKQCSKVISQTEKFVFFVIHAHSKKKVTPHP
jgi:hypothetical protein